MAEKETGFVSFVVNTAHNQMCENTSNECNSLVGDTELKGLK